MAANGRLELASDERASLEEALNALPARSAGRASAAGEVVYESVEDALDVLNDEAAREGTVVVYRDVAFLCERNGGMDWSAFKRGEDGAWIATPTADGGFGPVDSASFAALSREECLMKVCELCLASKDECAEGIAARSNPLDVQARALELAEADVEPYGPHEREAKEISEAVAETVDQAFVEEGLDEELAADVEAGAKAPALLAAVSAQLREKIERIVRDEARRRDVKLDDKSVRKVVSEQRANLFAGKRGAELKRVAVKAMPVKAVAWSLDGRAARDAQRAAREAARLARLRAMRRRKSGKHHKGEDFDAEEVPLIAAVQVGDTLDAELALDLQQSGWQTQVDVMGQEIMQPQEAYERELGVDLKPTFALDDGQWTYVGIQQDGRSDIAPTVEETLGEAVWAEELTAVQERLADIEATQPEYFQSIVSDQDSLGAPAQEALREERQPAQERQVSQEQAPTQERGQEISNEQEAHEAQAISPNQRQGIGAEGEPEQPKTEHEKEREQAEEREATLAVGATLGAEASAVGVVTQSLEGGYGEASIGTNEVVTPPPAEAHPAVAQAKAAEFEESIQDIKDRLRSQGAVSAPPPGAKAAGGPSNPAEERAAVRSAPERAVERTAEPKITPGITR